MTTKFGLAITDSETNKAATHRKVRLIFISLTGSCIEELAPRVKRFCLFLRIAVTVLLCNTPVTFTRAPVGTSFGPHQCVAGWFSRSQESDKIMVKKLVFSLALLFGFHIAASGQL